MGYVSHIFMYMDIRKHINLVKNHGYEGKIGMIKKDVHGIVMLAAKAGDIVLYRPYKEDENDYEENTTKYCSIETPLSEEQIQENRRNGCGLKTIGVCVNVPISIDVQIPDGRQISCISYNKVTYFDLDDICRLCFDSYDLHDVADTKVMSEFLHREGGRYWTEIDGVRQLYRRIECKMCFEVIEKLRVL